MCCSLNLTRAEIAEKNSKKVLRKKKSERNFPPPWTIKPSTLTGFMLAPPHDGFYSTVISEHVKYHSPTDKQDQTHTTILGHRMTDNVMIEWE